MMTNNVLKQKSFDFNMSIFYQLRCMHKGANNIWKCYIYEIKTKSSFPILNFTCL